MRQCLCNGFLGQGAGVTVEPGSGTGEKILEGLSHLTGETYNHGTHGESIFLLFPTICKERGS